MKAVQDAVKKLTQDELLKFEKAGSITVLGHELTAEEMSLNRGVKDMNDPNFHAIADSQTMLMMDFTYDEELYRIYLAKEVVNRVQKLRKEAKLVYDDPVDMWACVVPGDKKDKKEQKLAEVLAQKAEFIDKNLRRRLFASKLRQGQELVVREEEYEIEG